MARQIKKLTPKARLAKASKEALIEGAAGMSGKIVKKLAKDFLMGAMVKPKITETPRKKTSKKSLININKKPKTPGQYYTPGTIEMKVLDNKKSTNKMKKESAFKMKGFSGFKDESPVKAKTVTINKDGSKTVTRTRRDGSVKKVKEFKKGKKKAFKTTKTKRSGDTVTREFKKGVGGATITKRHSKDRSDYGSGSLGDKSFKQYAGKTYSETTRKDRRKNFMRGVGQFASGAAKVGLLTGGIGAAALAFPKATTLLLGGSGVGLGATAAGSIGRGVKNTVKKIAGNIKRKRKNPNRKRL